MLTGFLEPEEDSLLSVFSDLSVPSTSNFPLSPFSDLLDAENSNHTPPSMAASIELTGNSDSDSISFASEIINLIIETDESALSTVEETAEQRQSPYRRDDVSYLNVLVHRLAREALNGGQAISWKSIQDWALQAKGQLDKSGTLQFRATDLWICRFLRKHNVHSRKYNQERSEVKNSHSVRFVDIFGVSNLSLDNFHCRPYAFPRESYRLSLHPIININIVSSFHCQVIKHLDLNGVRFCRKSLSKSLRLLLFPCHLHILEWQANLSKFPKARKQKPRHLMLLPHLQPLLASR